MPDRPREPLLLKDSAALAFLKDPTSVLSRYVMAEILGPSVFTRLLRNRSAARAANLTRRDSKGETG